MKTTSISEELRRDAHAAKLPRYRVHGYDVYFERGNDGSYSCFAPTLPGCVSAGDSLTDCKKHMAEAIELHLEGMAEDGEDIPPRDGRAAPRPHRLRGRTIAISSRVSPEVAQVLARISTAKGISKTEAVEAAIMAYGKRLA